MNSFLDAEFVVQVVIGQLSGVDVVDADTIAVAIGADLADFQIGGAGFSDCLRLVWHCLLDATLTGAVHHIKYAKSGCFCHLRGGDTVLDYSRMGRDGWVSATACAFQDSVPRALKRQSIHSIAPPDTTHDAGVLSGGATFPHKTRL